MASINYAPPWLDAKTGETYGPKTGETYRRQYAEFKNWASKKQRPERAEAKLIHLYFRDHYRSLPESETEIYRAIYVHQESLMHTAEDLGLSRSTVRSYIKRLRKKAEDWSQGVDMSDEVPSNE